MLDRPSFLAAYAEFASAPTAVVDAKLAEAAEAIDPAIWGNAENEGHGLLTAHKLCLAPNGQFARLLTKEGQSTYGMLYDRRLSEVTCGIRVF